jgi:hypothetical protein
MNLLFAARAAAAFHLFVFITSHGVSAQSAPPNISLKEVQVGATEFSLADPVPSWVEPAAIPEDNKNAPLVFRLADTQFMVKETPTIYIHRALKIDDAASLTAAGQLAISFVPQYQHLHLHFVRVLRDQQVLDRTSSSAIRFLQREMGLEQGMYSGEITVSVLVNDLRVGDTLEYSYSVDGQNPVFGGTFADSAIWDKAYADGAAARRAELSRYPAHFVALHRRRKGQADCPRRIDS